MEKKKPPTSQPYKKLNTLLGFITKEKYKTKVLIKPVLFSPNLKYCIQSPLKMEIVLP